MTPRVSFSDHVALLNCFLDAHAHVTEAIESRVLTQRAMEPGRGGDRRHLQQSFDAAFASLPAVPRDLLRLHGQLAAAHLADGFEPAGGQSHALDPAALVVRGWEHWQRHRWPGRNVRLAHARHVFATHVLRQLEHLSLRIWDDGEDGASDRLRTIQQLLDRLNGLTPDAFVRDARWLIQTAQGPLTRHLAPYFRIAASIDESLTAADRLVVHRAGAALAGGHLRSQLHERSRESGRASDDPAVLAVARNSNSMDVALLVRDLVALLEAYESAADRDDERIHLADAIFQGLSADPELLLARLDLLGPCTAIEDLFVERDASGRVGFTAIGDAHRRMLERYHELIARLSARLEQDSSHFDPSRRTYSPLGLIYGFCEDILANMASDGLHGRPTSAVTLEELFESGGDLAHKQSRVSGWEARQPPGDERQPLAHSIDWARTMFERTMHALRLKVAAGAKRNASDLRDARLVVAAATSDVAPGTSSSDAMVRAQEHCVTSDLKRAMSTGATAFPRSQILADRNEGRFLASAESDGKWFAVSKVVLTTCIGQGQDALLTGVPPAAIDVLRLTCPDLLVEAPAPSERSESNELSSPETPSARTPTDSGASTATRDPRPELPLR